MFDFPQKSTSIYFLLFGFLPGKRKGIIIAAGGTQIKYLNVEYPAKDGYLESAWTASNRYLSVA